MEMPVLQAVLPQNFKQYTTETIRERFLMENCCKDNAIRFVYTHCDRMISGVAKPTTKALTLTTYENLRADYFLERREMGSIDLGDKSTVTVVGKKYNLQKLDCLFVEKGVKNSICKCS